MNSLTQLNNYVGSLTIDYTDVRAADVIFNINTPINQSTIVDQGFTFQSSVGIDITEVKNPGTANVSYTIQVTNVPGTTVSWASTPAGTTVTNPSPGTYTISGIDSYTIWDAVKYATIDTPDIYYGTFTYTSTINYTTATLGAQSKSWTTTVVVNQVTFLTTPSNFTYNPSSTQKIENTASIIDVDSSYPAVTWTVTITPSDTASITNFTTSATGGTFSVDASTKVITIEGTRAQVNAYLADISLVSNSTEIDFTLTYLVENSQDEVTDNAVQILENYGLTFLSNTSPFYYTEDDTETLLSGFPLITDSDYDGLGTYTLTITPSDINAFDDIILESNMSVKMSMACLVTITYQVEDPEDPEETINISVTSPYIAPDVEETPAAGTKVFNGITKILTLTGTRSQVNSLLTGLKYKLATDYELDFTLSYSLTTPRDETANKVQLIFCGSNDTEISYMNISRTYLTNNSNSIFSSNTPQIIDNDLTATNYTFTITSSFGQMSVGGANPSSNVITYTGTRSQCNTQLATVKFWPPSGSSSNGTFLYQQYKDGVLHAEYTVALLAQASEYLGKRSFILTSSQIWTPNYEDTLYAANWEVVLVGGGGGGGGYYVTSDNANRAAGGGGGGEVLQIASVPMTYQSYTVNVGAGGYVQYSGAVGTFADGEDTSAFGYTASGGQSGVLLGNIGQTTSYYENLSGTVTGGSSGNGYTGGKALWTVGSYYGGGGAGAGEDFIAAMPLGLVPSAQISGTRSSTNNNGRYPDTTFTDVPLYSLGGSDTGVRATVFIDGWTVGSNNWSDGCTVTITTTGEFSNFTVLKIDMSSLFGTYTSQEDIYITVLTGIDERAGKKGVYIAWDANENSIYGWYGGGGSGTGGISGSTYWNTVAPSGSIGNLITFANLGYTQSDGLTSDIGVGRNGVTAVSTTQAPPNSGGGGGGGFYLSSGDNGRGGSGVVGIRIT